MKRFMLGVMGLLLLASCSQSITEEQYIAAMTALGCKGATETTPQGAEALKSQGVTLEQIQAYRKDIGDRKKMMSAAMEIARRVMTCRGVLAPGQKLSITELPETTPPPAPKAP